MWEARADPHFERPERRAPTQRHSNCLKAVAMVQSLVKEGLMGMAGPGDKPNAQVFVQYKSELKAALIMNMVVLNHTCSRKAHRFKLLSLRCYVRWGEGHGLLSWTYSIVIGPSSFPHTCSGQSELGCKVPQWRWCECCLGGTRHPASCNIRLHALS